MLEQILLNPGHIRQPSAARWRASLRCVMWLDDADLRALGEYPKTIGSDMLLSIGAAYNRDRAWNPGPAPGLVGYAEQVIGDITGAMKKAGPHNGTSFF
ncbi:hypothetical protein [Rhizobium nepotum]